MKNENKQNRTSKKTRSCEERLLKHPYVINVLRVFNELTETAYEQMKENEKAKTVWDLPSEMIPQGLSYHNQVFRHTYNLMNTFERLDHIPFYLSRFPNSEVFRREGISLDTWIKYHHANFLTSYFSVYDLVLILTNQVFDLGLRHQDCNERTVLKNEKLHKSKVVDCVKAIKKRLLVHQEDRNLFVHRGELPTFGKLDKLALMIRIAEKSENYEKSAEDVDSLLLRPRVLNYLYKVERQDLIQYLRKETSELTTLIGAYFDELHPVYDIITKTKFGRK